MFYIYYEKYISFDKPLIVKRLFNQNSNQKSYAMNVKIV